jgi:hypothetical protein
MIHTALGMLARSCHNDTNCVVLVQMHGPNDK